MKKDNKKKAEKKLRKIIFLVILVVGLLNNLSKILFRPLTIISLVGSFIGLIILIAWWFILAFLIAKIVFWLKKVLFKN